MLHSGDDLTPLRASVVWSKERAVALISFAATVANKWKDKIDAQTSFPAMNLRLPNYVAKE